MRSHRWQLIWKKLARIIFRRKSTRIGEAQISLIIFIHVFLYPCILKIRLVRYNFRLLNCPLLGQDTVEDRAFELLPN